MSVDRFVVTIGPDTWSGSDNRIELKISFSGGNHSDSISMTLAQLDKLSTAINEHLFNCNYKE